MVSTSVHNEVRTSNTELEQQALLLELQRNILSSVANNNDHESQLNLLCTTAESMVPNSVASIMLLNRDKTALTVRAAPSIPREAIEQLNGLQPGPEAGSCGTAMYCGTPVYVANTMTDGRWKGVRDFAKQFSIHACWSNPIVNQDNEMAGSFALSNFETGEPNSFQKSLLDVCANLAGLILQREILENDLKRLAMYDPLTALPNRSYMLEQLTAAVKSATHNSHQVALLHIDVDNFKLINDNFGHQSGDEVLVKLAKTMQSCLREQDLLSRIAGDEFSLLIDDLTDPDEATHIAEKLLSEVHALTHAYQLDISASIGISIYPDDANNEDELMRHADTAMHAAKSSGKNRLHLYTRELTNLIREQVQLVNDLKRALNDDEFVLYYQPIFRANDLSIHGVEALIRWQHPEKGLLAPIHFITTAEQHGLISDITYWVMRESFQQTKAWLDKGCDIHRMSINLSAEDIKVGFHGQVSRLLKETQCPSEHIQFEITETIVMEHGLGVIAELEKVRDLGIAIALDDFGTGYSSLNQLKRLPVDKLKIDRSFIQDIPSDGDDVTLTKMIISMSKHLSLGVVAEGVETEEQADFLKQAGCDYLQGYLFAKPMPEVELCKLLCNAIMPA